MADVERVAGRGPAVDGARVGLLVVELVERAVAEGLKSSSREEMAVARFGGVGVGVERQRLRLRHFRRLHSHLPCTSFAP